MKIISLYELLKNYIWIFLIDYFGSAKSLYGNEDAIIIENDKPYINHEKLNNNENHIRKQQTNINLTYNPWNFFRMTI
jgi:hypothetical protein